MKKIIYLLFATAMFASCNSNKELKVTVENPSSFDRSKDLVEIPVTDLAKIKLNDGQTYVVKNAKGEVIPSQITHDNKLLFQSGIDKGKADFTISAGAPQEFKSQTTGRLVTERKDDFAWENDRVAFRIYGPALVAVDGPSNGIDVWYKRTSDLVTDKWYKADIAGEASYHEDHGEGLDDYKVGRSLGAGGMAPFVKDSLWLNENFTKAEVLDNGPLRTTVKLSYKNIDVDGTSFSESRTISLDAGSQLSKVVQEYGSNTPIKVAAGIPLRDDKDSSIVANPKGGYVIYVEPSEKAGQVFMATAFPSALDSIVKNTYTYINPKKDNSPETHTHILAVTTYQPNTPITYYTGYGWTKFGFATVSDFQTYIENFLNAKKEPLKYTIQ
ncbi:MAG: DUF4861 family protein [Dysgonomonas sp.]